MTAPMMLGSDPNLLRLELIHILVEAVHGAPRSNQLELGPSEIGDPCLRRVGYKLAGTTPRAMPANWKAQVGTWVHAGIASVFDQHNLLTDHLEGHPGVERWLIEEKVTVGTVAGRPITGTADLYDTVTGSVIDWKTCGPTMLDHYRRHGPGPQYVVQGHLYGQGFVNAGRVVETIMIVFLPRQGELADAVVWTEPFDPTVAAEALARLDAVATLVDAMGAEALPLLPLAPAYCSHCPYFRTDEPDPSVGCPGHPDARPPGLIGPSTRPHRRRMRLRTLELPDSNWVFVLDRVGDIDIDRAHQMVRAIQTDSRVLVFRDSVELDSDQYLPQARNPLDEE